MRAKEPCGCTHDGVYWISMCPPHRDECDTISKRWAAERLAPSTPERITYHGQAKPPDVWLEVPKNYGVLE